jgi:hypothetical protein
MAWHNAAISTNEETMTLRRNVVLCLLLALSGWNALAQSPAPKSPECKLTPVEWLVGGIWVSDVKDPSDGSMTHVENHITWAPNHRAIQFVTDFNGKPHYNGFYACDPVKKSIVFYYTSEAGQLTVGTATLDLDGKTLHQEFDTRQLDGTSNQVRSTIAPDGSNAYVFTVFLQQNGVWKQLFQITYKRKA